MPFIIEAKNDNIFYFHMLGFKQDLTLFITSKCYNSTLK